MLSYAGICTEDVFGVELRLQFSLLSFLLFAPMPVLLLFLCLSFLARDDDVVFIFCSIFTLNDSVLWTICSEYCCDVFGQQNLFFKMVFVS